MPRTPGNARASDRSPRRPVRVAPWPAGGPRDRVGHRVPGHWARMAGAWACPAGRTTEAATSSPNATPPGLQDHGRVPPNGRSPPGGQRSPPAAQQWLPAGWRSRMASLNRSCTETHPAPVPWRPMQTELTATTSPTPDIQPCAAHPYNILHGFMCPYYTFKAIVCPSCRLYFIF